MSQILLGRTQNSRFLPRIADYLGVELAWLIGTSDERRDLSTVPASSTDAAEHLKSALIPYFDQPYGMGATFVSLPTARAEMVPLLKDWLRARMHGRFDQLMLLPGRGDSMEPTIRDGDVLLIDRSQIEVREQDLIWAFDYGELGMVKRLRRRPRGGYVVQSDNDVVRPFEASDDEVNIVGRVISIMQWK